jgi:hypothetical protein
MSTKSAAGGRRRRIYWSVAACVLMYMAATTGLTVGLWRHKLVHDAVSVGSYATAVLAVSTIVLFGATALLAAATVDLVRTERETARREEEKYESERGARIAEEHLRAQQAEVYALQIRELEQRLTEQERAQARAIDMATADLSLVLTGAPARSCRVVRVENRSHLPIFQCRCTIVVAEGVIEHAQAGTVTGALTANRLAEFTQHPGESQNLVINPGQSTDFAFLTGTERTGGTGPLVSFTDAAGLSWRLDAHSRLEPELSQQTEDPPVVTSK